MKIQDAKNAIKVCDFVKKDQINDIHWSDSIDSNFKKDNSTKVYIITSNDEIVKIGSSQDKGGIQQTLSFYRTGGISGRPSTRSIGIYLLIKEELEKNKNVSVYLIKQNKVKAHIIGLTKQEEQEININPNDAETFCLNEYNNFHQKINPSQSKYLPIWNFKERGEDWPEYIKTSHAKVLNESLTRNKNKNKTKIKNSL